MRKTCAVCPVRFEAKRSAAKYCSPKCRKRAHRHPELAKAASGPESAPDEGQVRVLPGGGGDEASAGHEVDGEVTTATRDELEAAGRTATSAGRAALALARRIDGGVLETGSAFAALVRQHETTLATALKGAKRSADALDELTERRMRKKSGA